MYRHLTIPIIFDLDLVFRGSAELPINMIISGQRV